MPRAFYKNSQLQFQRRYLDFQMILQSVPQISGHFREFLNNILGLTGVGSQVIKAGPLTGLLAGDVLEIVPIQIVDRTKSLKNGINIIVKGRDLTSCQLPHILPIHILIIVNSRQRKKCRHKINSTDKTINALPTELLVGMPDNQRNMSNTGIKKGGGLLHASLLSEVGAVVG